MIKATVYMSEGDINYLFSENPLRNELCFRVSDSNKLVINLLYHVSVVQ